MTHYDPDKHHRRSIRLRGFDYAGPGAYFVTICTHERECLFGDVVDGEVVLNEYGRVVESCWQALPGHFPHVRLDAFVVMPNHVHGVIVLTESPNVGAGFPRPDPVEGAETAPLRTLGQGVAHFKYQSTKNTNAMRGTPGVPVWQRNYYEHVVRDEDEWNTIRAYVAENPLRWEMDENHPRRLGPRENRTV